MNEAIAVTEEAIERVEAAADPDWLDAAAAAVIQAATHLETLTVDDVWTYMPEDVSTHDNRAMGPVMRRAMVAGLIEPTSDYRLSEQVQCHRNPRRVWKSMRHQQS